MLYINNIDNSRFRAIFREFQQQTSVPAVYVDFKNWAYSFSDLEAALTDGKSYNRYKDKIVYFLVDNIGDFDHITALENIFLTYNASYILQSLPKNLFEMSALGKWTHKYEF